jgi:hypothetical protein
MFYYSRYYFILITINCAIIILLYYYIIISLYRYIIQLIFCRRLCQGVVAVRPTLVHPPPYCLSPCRLWRGRITAQRKTVYPTRITRALLTLPRPTLVQLLTRSSPLHRLWQRRTTRQQKAPSIAVTISISVCSSF